MAVGNKDHHDKRFNLLWGSQEEVELRIPQLFWNVWGDEVYHIIEVWDPVGNQFHCGVNHDDEGGYFMADLTTTLHQRYHVERTVMVYFRMLKSNLFLIHIEATLGEVYVYPRFNIDNQLQFYDEGDGVLSEESVEN